MKKIYVVFAFFFIQLSSCEKDSFDAFNYSGVTFTNFEMRGENYILKKNVVVYSEIIGYDSTEHVFLLSDEAGERIRDVDYPVSPTKFAVAVDGQIIYIANFIPGYSSASCDDCITMEPYSYSNLYPVRLGYPGNSSLFFDDDPRNDARIIERFKKDDKLNSF